jgi:GTP cyclohydrolase II
MEEECKDVNVDGELRASEGTDRQNGQPILQHERSDSVVSVQLQQHYGRLVLTTYPGQPGVQPIALRWYAPSAQERGPVIVSRANLSQRNAIGASSGSYCIYHALAVACGALPPNHRPDYCLTEPAIDVAPNEAWSTPGRIVSLDPYGHIAPFVYSECGDLDIRPSIALTQAHLTIPELRGRLQTDGQIVMDGAKGELHVTKGAVESVWYLPGVAARFGVPEADLRRILFEDTGGMYPELVTRPDLHVFLPPIGGLSLYVFGDLKRLQQPDPKVCVRVHDECNGSDVFGSDICTCRPYLIYGIEQAVLMAQQGGVGLIVYYRKEGRALGEVVKYLVYNARKRQPGGDTAAQYFARTEQVAGVKDLRFQALMPDVLHWLGIKKIDRLVSMSNMKLQAIRDAGIVVGEQVALPSEWLPADSAVEIAAKLADGYYGGQLPSHESLDSKGRGWDDLHH